MILQRLYEYYQRKAENSTPPGLEWKEIPYLIIINSDGEFIRFESTIEPDDKSKRGKKFLVPKSKARSGSKSWETANSFWDHYGYVLGHPKTNKIKPELEDKFKSELEKNESDALKQRSSFQKEVEKHLQLYPDNKGFRAVSLFYDISENINR